MHEMQRDIQTVDSKNTKVAVIVSRCHLQILAECKFSFGIARRKRQLTNNFISILLHCFKVIGWGGGIWDILNYWRAAGNAR